MYVGLSSFAIQSPKFPIDRWLKIMHRGSGPRFCTVLWRVFGDDQIGLTRFMEEFRDRPKLIEIHFSNGAGREVGTNTGKGTFAPNLSVNGLIKKLRANDPRLMAEIDERTNDILGFFQPLIDPLTELVICPELEDNFKEEHLDAYKIFHKRIKTIWPYKTARSSIEDGKHKDGANFYERHGSDARGDSKTICNEDGEEKATLEGTKKFLAENKKRGAVAAAIWRRPHQGSGLPRRERVLKISAKDEVQVGDLMERY